jgi:hypothetical protein
MIAFDNPPSEAKLFSVMKSVGSQKKRSTKLSQDHESGEMHIEAGCEEAIPRPFEEFDDLRT